VSPHGPKAPARPEGAAPADGTPVDASDAREVARLLSALIVRAHVTSRAAASGITQLARLAGLPLVAVATEASVAPADVARDLRALMPALYALAPAEAHALRDEMQAAVSALAHESTVVAAAGRGEFSR
jgi:hypothetical protein